MTYPNTLAVIAPIFTVAKDKNKRAFSNRLVFLTSFAVLHAVRDQHGRIDFRERIEVDAVGDGSIDLLVKLAEEIDSDATIAGRRLHDVIGSLVRVPRDCEREPEGKAPLMRLKLALGNAPIDVAWFDNDSGALTLNSVADRLGLLPWSEKQSGNPTFLRQQLSSRVRCIWAAIAEKHLEPGEERRRAFSSFEQFQSRGCAMT